MSRASVDPGLMALFLDEVRDKTDAIERHLLSLESMKDGEARSETVGELMTLAHNLKGAAGFVEARGIEAACHWMEDVFSSARIGKFAPGLFDRLLAAIDAIREIGRLMEAGQDVTKVPLAFLSQEAIPAEGADDAGLDGTLQFPTTQFRASDTDGSVRLPSDKFDTLLYRSEELLMTRLRGRGRSKELAGLAETAVALRERLGAEGRPEAESALQIERSLRAMVSEIGEDIRQMESAALHLEQEIRRARMQPFSVACGGLQRAVRDACMRLGKRANLSVEGGSSEIDRSIIAVLREALLHLVRNAVDHGIEAPADRTAAGKPVDGRITIAASVAGDRLRVTISDDGRGISLEKLRSQAVAHGVKPDADERTLLMQIFRPGYSTAETVTEISGRGIGLVAVRKAVEKLRGMIEVSNVSGSGVTFKMALPLSLALTRALVVVAGGQLFAIETAIARRLVQASAKNLLPDHGRTLFELPDGLRLPVLDLPAWLGKRIGPREHGSFPIVIVGTRESETAIIVDSVTGEQEVLVKPLGPRMSGLRRYSGGAIMADGGIALVLNSSTLAEAALGNSGDGTTMSGEDNMASVEVRKHILVADDSPTARAFLASALQGAGYEVVAAEDGAKAWETLCAEGADAVVADVEMPGMNGYALVKAIRESERFKGLPVVLVTSKDTEADMERGREAGADAQLSKGSLSRERLQEVLAGFF